MWHFLIKSILRTLYAPQFGFLHQFATHTLLPVHGSQSGQKKKHALLFWGRIFIFHVFDVFFRIRAKTGNIVCV